MYQVSTLQVSFLTFHTIGHTVHKNMAVKINTEIQPAYQKRSQQLGFSNLSKDPALKKSHSYGGTLRNKAQWRGSRPISDRKPMHLVLRSSLAQGTRSLKLPKNSQIVLNCIKKHAHKYHVRIEQFANGGNHIHILLRLGSRHLYGSFIRAVTGELAMKLSQSRIGVPLRAGRRRDGKLRFWDHRPFTRVVVGRRGYLIAKDYVWLNKLEGLGVIPYQSQRLQQARPGELARFFEQAWVETG